MHVVLALVLFDNLEQSVDISVIYEIILHLLRAYRFWAARLESVYRSASA